MTEVWTVTAMQFDKILSLYQKKWRILSADEWFEKSEKNTLEKKDVCLTFDDTLLCQFEIALPILEKRGLKAFWFIDTAPLQHKIIKLELYRHFRFTYFKNVAEFYQAFDAEVRHSRFARKIMEGLKQFDPRVFYHQYAFYTVKDRWFRYIRDVILSKAEFERIMDTLVRKTGADQDRMAQNLWMNKKCLAELSKKGHILGLHSHTHPTDLKRLAPARQYREYATNLQVLRRIVKKPIHSMSHPNGSYSATTLAILRKLGITVGFRDTREKERFSKLSYPRLDHSYLLKKLQRV
ncbi:MAG: polysaccharide deacetylase family protein [Parcubacteria group bacterium]|nr:polysaccharide deacetylase family protein [Parcubacteria group bacterium]